MRPATGFALAALLTVHLAAGRGRSGADPKPPEPPAGPADTAVVYDGPEAAAVADLRAALRGYRAGEVRLEKVELGGRTGQEFYLGRAGGKTLVRYTTAQSLENAVYSLLDRWGFRWYGPGDNWVVKPAAVPADDIPGRWHAPAFRNRSFFGTGGLDAPVPGDPGNRYKAGWYAWKRRNRFNADYPATGHTGDAFYAENKALLDAHPDWFNGDKGRRHGRIRVEVPEAVAAYAAWVKKKHEKAAGPFVALGVDPEDGRGGADDPLPPDGFAGLAGWTHADKWWWLANEVAKGYPEDGRVVVTMYAYGDGPTNALTPRFPLRKNVYPVIIPYAFQTAYLPAGMVRAWAEKVDGRMGVYDYWNITQWSRGLPQFDIFSIPGKLRFWRANRVDGLYAETTDAAGPMGHAWWLAGQLLFDPDRDLEGLYRQYLTELFGRAAPAVRRMYDRWSRHPQGAGEASLTLDDLRAADALVEKGSPEWRRVNELAAYAHFLKLMTDHDGTVTSRDRLFRYLYSIHHLYLVQTSAFVGQRYVPPNAPRGEYAPKEAVPLLTPDEIDAQFRADLRTDPKRYEVSDFRFDFSKVSFTEPAAPAAWRFGNTVSAYVVPREAGEVAFDAGCEKAEARVWVAADDAVLVDARVGPKAFDHTETLDGRTWHLKRFAVRVEAGKRYTIRVAGGFNRLKVHGKEVVFNAHRAGDFDNYAYPPHYLYVPRGCTEVVFENTAGQPGHLVGPGGEKSEATPLGIRNLYRVSVPAGWRGRVVAARFAHSSWELRNPPNVTALQPFAYAE